MAGKYLEQQLDFFSLDVTSYCMDEVLRAFDDLPFARPQEVHLSQKKQQPKRPKEVVISLKQLQQIKRQQAALNQKKQVKPMKQTTKTKPRNVKRKRNPCSLCHIERHGVRRRRLPCGHVFHKTCFWTQLSINCPLCPRNDDGCDIDEEYVQEYK